MIRGRSRHCRKLDVSIALHRFFQTMQQHVDRRRVAFVEPGAVKNQPRPIRVHDSGNVMNERELLLHAPDVGQLPDGYRAHSVAISVTSLPSFHCLFI